GDAPAGIGGGVGCFLWFQSRAGLLDFIANHLTFWVPGPADVDPGRVWSEVKKIVSEVENGQLTISEAIRRLNSALRHFSQIKWIGTSQDLIAGAGDFERELHGWFREDQNTDVPDHAITRK